MIICSGNNTEISMIAAMVTSVSELNIELYIGYVSHDIYIIFLLNDL